MLDRARRSPRAGAGGRRIALEPDGRDELDAPRSPSEQAPTRRPGRWRRVADAHRDRSDRLLVAVRRDRESTDLDALGGDGRSARHPPLDRPDRPHRADRPGRRRRARAAPADRRRHRGRRTSGRRSRRSTTTWSMSSCCSTLEYARRGRAPRDSTSCSASSYLLTVHGSATDLARRVTMRDGVGAVLARRAPTSCSTPSPTRIVDGYFPMSSTSWPTRSTTSRTE